MEQRFCLGYKECKFLVTAPKYEIQHSQLTDPTSILLYLSRSVTLLFPRSLSVSAIILSVMILSLFIFSLPQTVEKKYHRIFSSDILFLYNVFSFFFCFLLFSFRCCRQNQLRNQTIEPYQVFQLFLLFVFLGLFIVLIKDYYSRN